MPGFDTIIGPVVMRGIDNQSTMGAWVGKLAVKGASGGMTDWKYIDGPAYALRGRGEGGTEGMIFWPRRGLAPVP